MENLQSFGDFEQSSPEDLIIKGSIDIERIEKTIRAKIGETKKRGTDLFHMRLEEVLNPSLSAKELIERIIKAALEVEFGPSFTLSRGFDKMVSSIADTIITNPDLRRQALSIASIYIRKKMDTLKDQGKKS